MQLRYAMSSLFKKPKNVFIRNKQQLDFPEMQEKEEIQQLKSYTKHPFNKDDQRKVKYENTKRNQQKESNQSVFGDFSKTSEDDDIHSIRLQQAISAQTSELDGKDTKFYKFNFFRKSLFKQLQMDELNYINVHDHKQVQANCPTLKHNLDFIPHTPGIYPFEQVAKLFDKSDDLNFLRNIYPSEELILERFNIYLPPSKDQELLKQAKKAKMRYVMATSTISNFLCQIFYAISGFRSPYFESIFEEHISEPKKYMISQRKPISNYIHRVQENKHQLYVLDGDSGFFLWSPILMNVGNIVERQLTMDKQQFENHFVSKDQPKDLQPLHDHHRLMKLNNEILLRSQIDCISSKKDKDPFVFEIKSRAVCPIRYDFPNCLEYTDYEITQNKGLHSSYEREYYDLIRGAFLKWSFQLRIGRMSGAFVAYHNLRQIQGFEFITAEEIDKRIYGSTYYAETVFVVSSKLLTTILDELFDQHLNREDFESIKLGVYAQSFNRKLIMFAELFKKREDIKKYVTLFPTSEIANEYDYFEKVQPLVNKVLKFEVLLHIEVNGVIQVGHSIPFRQGDLLNVYYRVRPLGLAQYNDYMNFLHDCYKFEELNLDLNYAGAWVKQQQ